MRFGTSVALAVLWLLAVGSGSVAFARYKSMAGEPGAPPPRWPGDTRLVLAEDRPTLILWAHPRCPCTRASVAELARLMAVLDDRVRASVVFLLPDDAGPDWERTDLWDAARAIPGLRVEADRGHVEADRFGAATSGHVVLFGPDGSLWFSGGLTPARGHQGDSVGRAAILERVLGGSSIADRSPIFGCGLWGTP